VSALPAFGQTCLALSNLKLGAIGAPPCSAEAADCKLAVWEADYKGCLLSRNICLRLMQEVSTRWMWEIGADVNVIGLTIHHILLGFGAVTPLSNIIYKADIPYVDLFPLSF